MLPSIAYTSDLVLDTEENNKTKTFALNLNTNTVGGIIDDLEALKQSIYLRLSTEADQHIIYPYTHGLKTVDLIGEPYYYIVAILPNRIKDALLDDDRITDVDDFTFTVENNSIGVSFTVTTIYGKTSGETVVRY